MLVEWRIDVVNKISVCINHDTRKVKVNILFLNNCGREDFSQIPYASIRMYEGTPERVKEVFASYVRARRDPDAGSRPIPELRSLLPRWVRHTSNRSSQGGDIRVVFS